MMRMADMRQVVWLSVHLALLVALGFNIALPILDHHAAERDPWHAHLVLGGHGQARRSALAEHRHGHATPHVHHPDTSRSTHRDTQPDDVTVVAIAADDGVGAAVLGLNGKILGLLLVCPSSVLLCPVARLWPDARSIPLAPDLASPTPPPRIAG